MYISNNPPAPRPTASGHADVDAAGAASAEPASSCRPGPQEDCSPPPGPTTTTTTTLPLTLSEPPSSSSSSSSSSSQPPSSTAGPPPSETVPIPRRTSFPISFPPIFFQRTKAPSASLAPSTAEGKPAQLTNPKDDHHTSALQKLNSKYPSVLRRHGYTPEAPGAQSSTYSQPVLVRTYSGPPPSQGSRSTRSRQYRPPSSGRGVSRRVPLPSGSAPGSAGPGRPIQPTVSDVGVGTTSGSSAGADRHAPAESRDRSVYGANMPRPYKAKKPNAATASSKLPLGWPWLSSRQEPEEPKLPPLEAFSFKSFMADLQGPGGDNDIGADLDRIAEICARSRYSLSNQYEVHVAPHGSGSAFMSGAGLSASSAPRRKGHSRSRSHGHAGGPTLQAITSDDENSTRSNPRKRNPGKRRNTAYGTLETIMSSSRSSEEDKSKKKSASALVGEVRGRAAKKAWGNSASSASASASTPNSGGSADAQTKQQQDPDPTSPTKSPTDSTRLARKKSASFATAIMDTSSRSSAKAGSSSSSRQRRATLPSSSALLSEPARPQTSNSHLGVRTTPPAPHPPPTPSLAGRQQQQQQRPRPTVVDIGGESLPHPRQDAVAAAGSAGWSAWVPWRMAQGGTVAQEPAAGPSHAEGSLRLLLRTATGEAGKGVGQAAI